MPKYFIVVLILITFGERIMSQMQIIGYTQIPLFIFGQCISQFLNYFVVGNILFNLGTSAMLLSLTLQIWAMIKNKKTNHFLKTQKSFRINYVLTGLTMYLNYEYIAVSPPEMYDANLITVIVGMCRLFFQTLAYSLILLPKITQKEMLIYFMTLVYWVTSNAYQTIEVIKKAHQQQYQAEQKDIGICLLGLITGNVILMMDLYIRSQEQQQKKQTHNSIEMKILS